jgi:hypothetical protein
MANGDVQTIGRIGKLSVEDYLNFRRNWLAEQKSELERLKAQQNGGDKSSDSF